MANFTKYLIIIFYIFFTNVALSQENIYYIDMESIMNNSLAGKSIIKQLENENKSFSNSFKKTEENLKKDETKLISQKNILEKKEFDEKVILFQKKVTEYRNERQTILNNFSSKKNNAQKVLIEKLIPILAEYSESNSISMILPKQNIIIGKSNLDLTKTVIDILNEKVKSIKLN
jgi:Skp family chaperone for outer membrane proteins